MPDAAQVTQAGLSGMTTDERANWLADHNEGDPWELVGYFREKARQATEVLDSINARLPAYAERVATQATEITRLKDENARLVEAIDAWFLDPTPDTEQGIMDARAALIDGGENGMPLGQFLDEFEADPEIAKHLPAARTEVAAARQPKEPEHG